MILQKQFLLLKQETESYKDQTIRQAQDIDRLIDEKRDLEELVEQAHASIKQVRINQGMPPNSALKENFNLQNHSHSR